jgi:hypothetical protein
MAKIKSLVTFGFFAVLVHDLHAQAGSIRCSPSWDNYDFPSQGNGLPAPTSTRTNTITITATGTVILRIRSVFPPSGSSSPTISSAGGATITGVPTSWTAWGTTGVQVRAGIYRVVITANNPAPLNTGAYYVQAGISDSSGQCFEDSWYGRLVPRGSTSFGSTPTATQLAQITTCGAGPGSGGGGGGSNAGPIAGPGAGNSPPNNKDRFTVLLNTGDRRLVVGQLQGNNFTSFGGLGTFNARNSLRDGNMLRLFYIPMISASTGSGCCLSGLNRSVSGSGNRAVTVRSLVSRGSGRVFWRR